MVSVTTNPDYSYAGIGCSLAVHMAEKVLVINKKAFPFSDVRGVRTFNTNGFFLKTTGIEIEVNDLDKPIIRVRMNSKPQRVWVSRIGQICEMKSY